MQIEFYESNQTEKELRNDETASNENVLNNTEDFNIVNDRAVNQVEFFESIQVEKELMNGEAGKKNTFDRNRESFYTDRMDEGVIEIDAKEIVDPFIIKQLQNRVKSRWTEQALEVQKQQAMDLKNQREQEGHQH